MNALAIQNIVYAQASAQYTPLLIVAAAFCLAMLAIGMFFWRRDAISGTLLSAIGITGMALCFFSYINMGEKAKLAGEILSSENCAIRVDAWAGETPESIRISEIKAPITIDLLGQKSKITPPERSVTLPPQTLQALNAAIAETKDVSIAIPNTATKVCRSVNGVIITENVN